MGKIPILLASSWVWIVSGQPAAPSIPAGLWRSQEEGFVIRIEACEGGFCGFAAGAPAKAAPNKKKRPKPEEICGKQMLKGFQWNSKSSRWEGKMEPPGSSLSLNATVTSDGKTFLTMKGRMLIVSKTMSFVPYVGPRIGPACQMD